MQEVISIIYYIGEISISANARLKRLGTYLESQSQIFIEVRNIFLTKSLNDGSDFSIHLVIIYFSCYPWYLHYWHCFSLQSQKPCWGSIWLLIRWLTGQVPK